MNLSNFSKLFIYFGLVLYFTLDNIYIMENVLRGIGFLKSMVYLSVYLSVVFTTFILLLFQNRYIRHIALLLVLISLSISFTYLDINGYGFRFSEARIMLSEIHFAGEALSTFANSIYIAIFKSIFIVAILYLISEKFIEYRFSNRWLLIPFVSLASMYFLVIRSLDFYPFPIVFKVPSTILYAYNNSLYFGDRESVNIKLNESISNKILFIVDESITANKMSINGYSKDSTPFLRTIEKDIYNYKESVSGANCSATSNFILQTGVQASSLPDTEQNSLKKANIFKYAKNAGYKTLYIDGQNPQESSYQNFMTKFDYKDIDIYYQIRLENPDIERYNIDLKGLEFIKDILSKNIDEKVFIYFNKYGSHFHYEGTYPKSAMKFTPTLELDEWNSSKTKSINSYLNSISWSCDNFIKEAVELNSKGVTTIYTSDHGQNILDIDSMVTHCKARNSDSYQASVPLIIYFDKSQNQRLDKLLRINYKNNIGYTSHFNIFSTLLIMQGYSKDEVNKIYGSSIFDNLSTQKERYFFSGDLWGRGDSFKNIFNLE